jgi:hypothetical protein
MPALIPTFFCQQIGMGADAAYVQSALVTMLHIAQGK